MRKEEKKKEKSARARRLGAPLTACSAHIRQNQHLLARLDAQLSLVAGRKVLQHHSRAAHHGLTRRLYRNPSCRRENSFQFSVLG